MDVAPQPPTFLDFLDVNAAPSTYDSPDPEVENGTTIFLNPFSPYNSKQDLGSFQTPNNGGNMFPRTGGFPDEWDGYAEQPEPLESPGQDAYFVDPDLGSPESDAEQAQAQTQAFPLNPSQAGASRASFNSPPPERTFSSASMSTDLTPPDQPAPKRRRVRRPKRHSNVTEEDHKRNKFLERNRIAASKCREKKKQYVTELEDRKSALEFHNHQLRVEFDALVGEISELKHQLMAHAKCNDPHIDLWLQKEAAKFVQTTDAGAYAQSSMAFAHGLPSELPTANSDHSRNHSIASSYASLQGMQFEGLNAGERQGSIAYSHASTGSLYPSPTNATFPELSPHLKREPDLSYSAAADPMYGSEQPTFTGG